MLKEYACAELCVKNSRFIAEVLPVASQAEARRVLKEQKTKYAGASHVVHAFVLGPSGGILGCSDDGEPSGTAGRPVLDVLKGRGITGILVTVTRYFGGTLLGTGGLVKAYGDSAKAVLDKAVCEPLVRKVFFQASVPYPAFDAVSRALSACAASVRTAEYGTDIVISGDICSDSAAVLGEQLRDVSNGRVRLVFTENLPG